MSRVRGMSVRKVVLNHAASRDRQALAGRVLLAMGVIALCLVLHQLRQLGMEKRALESEVASLQHPQVIPRPKALPASEQAGKREEFAAASKVMQELAMPWEPLFTALENIRLPQISLVAVEPNPSQHKLRLTLESENKEAMLEYVRILGQLPMLKEAVLQTHEQSNDGRAMPISFVVEAIWQL
ncbi:MAG: hypothetical protein ACXW1P_07005 [Methylophilaceae bacterium]